MEEKLMLERLQGHQAHDEYNIGAMPSIRLRNQQQQLSYRNVHLGITVPEQPDVGDYEEHDDDEDSVEHQPNQQQSSQEHGRNKSGGRSVHQQQQHSQFSAKSPKGQPNSNAASSPRGGRYVSSNASNNNPKQAAKGQRQLPPGYKTQEQLDAEKQAQQIKEAYLNNAAANSKSNAAIKAQYEMERGYMSKHHIATLEQQIKKMQRELEKARLDAMTPDEMTQYEMNRKMKSSSKVVKLWALTREDAAAIRIQKTTKQFLKRLRFAFSVSTRHEFIINGLAIFNAVRKLKEIKKHCLKQIGAVVYNYLISWRARSSLNKLYAQRWAQLVIGW
jgi:hypothetical protein